MQSVIVGVIVIIAAAYLVRRFYRKAKALEQGTCGCDCDGCSQISACDKVSASDKER